MTTTETLQFILGSGGLLGVVIGIVFFAFRTGKIIEKVTNIEGKVTGIDEKLDIFKKEIRNDIRNLQDDISDIKERVSFMEAFVFFSEFKAESNNTRSQSAKKMWERRKMKKVEAKEK